MSDRVFYAVFYALCALALGGSVAVAIIFWHS
jgi:peroxiredoxin family protein